MGVLIPVDPQVASEVVLMPVDRSFVRVAIENDPLSVLAVDTLFLIMHRLSVKSFLF